MIRFKRITLLELVLILIFSSFVNAYVPQNLTRVGFVKEILMAMDVEIEKLSSSPFSDISMKEDIPYVATAANKNIVTGHGGEFSPEAPVTNEQAVIMLVRALGVINIDEDEASKVKINFSDAGKISHWAKPYVSYGIKYGLINDSVEKFEPQRGITKLESEAMLNKFKKAFVRDGLTASEILKLADDNLKKYDTYKFKGTMDSITNVKLPTGEKQVVTSKIFQEGIFEKPETVYTISKDTSNIDGQRVENVSEVYMKDRIIYTRNGKDQKWVKMNLDPMMIGLESIMGNTNQGMPQLSSKQLESVGMYARYGQDIEINGEEYYVIKVDLDSEAFMKVYSKIMNETSNYMFEGEMWEQMKKEQGVPATMDEKTFKATIKSSIEQALKTMDIQIIQEYYIHKGNKNYSKLNIKQLVNIDSFGVETKIEMNGQYEYHGFGEEVTFPKIN